MQELARLYNQRLDEAEAIMHQIGLSDFETSGFLVNGMYVRSIFIPAGSYLTSKIHATDHPFILSEGEMIIFTEDGGEQVLKSPFIDITKAGTRRFAHAVTDCLWTTVHRTDKETEQEIESEVIIYRENPLLKLINE